MFQELDNVDETFSLGILIHDSAMFSARESFGRGYMKKIWTEHSQEAQKIGKA